MLARSFAEFHAQRGMSDERAALALDAAALRKVRKLIEEESLADPSGWAAAEKHDEATFLSRAAAKQVRAAVLNSKGAQSAMTVGRVLLVAHGGERLETDSENGDKYVADGVDKYGALLRVCDAEQRDGSRFKDASESESGISYGAHAEGGEGGEGGSGSPSKTYVVLFACPEGHPERDDEMTSSGRFKRGDASAAIRADAETKTVLSLKPRGATGSDDVFRLSASSNSKKNYSADDSGRHSWPRGLPWRLVSGGASYVVAAVDADDVLAITGARVDVDANALLGETFSGSSKSRDPPSASFAAAASRALAELERVCGKDACSLPAPLHPTKDLKLVDIASVEACLEHARLVSLVPPFPQTAAREKRLAWRALLAARRRLVSRVGDREHSLSDANLQQMPDFEARVSVLQQMGYLDADRTVTLKGRVACEIATGDELVGAEMIFAGVLTDVSPAAAAAVLSALVFQEKNASAPELESAPDLRDACARTFDLAVNAGTTQKSKGLPIDPPEYASNALKFGLCEVVHEWAKGAAFADVCSLTDVQEGSIVRTITRLDEMTRDVRNAARIMGDSALFEKMELASAAIKRDIVFSASLYVAGAK
jgi:antiviral helicase SKI2